MAKLIGPLRISGTLGDLTFCNHPSGKTIIRNKSEVAKRNMKLASLQNCAEFSEASQLAGKVRSAFSQYLEYLSDGSHFTRLVGLSNIITRTDFTNTRGKRKPFNGNLFLLEDFQWNTKLGFKQALQAEFTPHIDAVSGRMQLDIPSFVPLRDMKTPPGATHFQIILRGAAIHPEESNPHTPKAVSRLIPVSAVETGDISLSVTVDKGMDEGAFLLGAGIIFFEEVDELALAMRYAGASAILAVEKISTEEVVLEINDETGEVAPVALPQEQQEARKLKRAAAMNVALAALHTNMAGYSMELTAITEDPIELARIGEQRMALQKKLWLRRVNKYRNGF